MNNSIYRFKVTIKQQLLVLLPFFLINVLIFFGAYYYLGITSFDKPTLIFSIFILITNVLPVLILHIQYLIKGNTELIVDKSKRTLKFKDNNGCKEYHVDDIEYFDYFATHGHISKRGSSLWYTFDPYRFYKIGFKDSQTAYITCLTINDIENTLEPILVIQAEWKFRAIPLLY